ncbi:hypothetical protein CVH10_08000 [Halomonas sp. ND22Bw]|uniref:DUF4412 domain-containing protein n=1 Tax=Halomonas salina TaxID=42565 RepID=A0ABR4WVV0_9GAMM|nr:hypothetical protein [Halomonas salina]KGE78836.1 hypothetical protein FP66_00675 [Halomonas salina]PSJ22438.1 hypothetical protein CVH10_08000 [Halomonas sp. ND22Bw]
MRHLVTGLLLAASLPALADGQATLESRSDQGNATMEVRWAGDDLRMDFPQQAQAGFMLLKDGNGYMVTRMQGQTLVMDMARLKQMAESMGGDQAMAGVTSQQADSVERLEATGERETVAGLEGEVYALTWTDKAGNAHDDTLVLSDDDQVRELMRAFHAYQRTMTGEPDPIASALEEEGLGMLRFGDRFRIASLSDEAPAASAFELPEDAMSMEDMMNRALSQ